jgi:hypothetical protein
MKFKNIIEHPKTIDEAVNKLLVILTDQEKEQVKALPEEDLVLLHVSLGREIRNAFGLNNGNTALLGQRSADNTAMKIIEELWKRLQRRKKIRQTLL